MRHWLQATAVDIQCYLGLDSLLLQHSDDATGGGQVCLEAGVLLVHLLRLCGSLCLSSLHRTCTTCIKVIIWQATTQCVLSVTRPLDDLHASDHWQTVSQAQMTGSRKSSRESVD